MLGAAGAGALLAAGVTGNGIAAGERQYANACRSNNYSKGGNSVGGTGMVYSHSKMFWICILSESCGNVAQQLVKLIGNPVVARAVSSSGSN